MSAKAQMLLGVMPESDQRRYKTSPRLSRRTSDILVDDFDLGGDPPLRSTTSSQFLSPSTDRTAFSISSSNDVRLHDAHGMLASSDRPGLSPRVSNSTLQSFAPPTVPTYLPRHMGSTFVPHVAYGRVTVTKPKQSQYPPSRPPISQQTLPSSPDHKHGLRKALSRISLRSNRSWSRVSDAHRPDPSTFRQPTPSSTHGTESATLAHPSAQQDFQEPRLRPKTSGFAGGTGSGQETAQQSASRLARSRRGLTGGSKEWFDALDTGEEDIVGDIISPTETSSLGRVTRRKNALSRPLRDLETHLSPHTRIKRDSVTPQPSEPTTSASWVSEAQQTMRSSKASVICEQTMFDLTDSDSDNEESASRHVSNTVTGIATHRRQRSSKGSGILKSARMVPTTSRHERQSSNTSVQTRTISLISSGREDEALLRKMSMMRLEDALTESMPSLVGSGPSRPTSYLSTQPSSPLCRLSDADPKSFMPITIAHEERWSESELFSSEQRTRPKTAKLLELKSGASAARIVASLSPEEAILLAKIRRNRTDTAVNEPVSTSESDTLAEESDSVSAGIMEDVGAGTNPQPELSDDPTSDNANFFHPLARLAAEDSARLARRDSILRAALSSPSCKRLSVLSESDDTLAEFPTPPSSARTSAALQHSAFREKGHRSTKCSA